MDWCGSTNSWYKCFVVGTATRESDCADDEADFDDTLEEYDNDGEPVLEFEESDAEPKYVDDLDSE